MADNRKDEHNREATKLCFEFFKHFSTLSITVALVEIALVQFFELDSKTAVVSSIASGVTLLSSIVGMLIVAIPASLDDEVPKTGSYTYILMFITAFAFFFGLLGFATAIFIPPGTDAGCLDGLWLC